jgi:hypothetical protein
MRRKNFWIAAGCILVMVGLRPVFSSGAPPAAGEKVIYSFQGGTDGAGPSDLTMDSEGNLYGTTGGGGEPTCVYYGDTWNGCGTVYELKRTQDGWKEQILFRFNANGDNVGGALPAAGVTFDKAGNIYGTTSGNPNDCGQGNVFKLTPDSHGEWKETVLYTFTCGNGYNPDSDLVFDAQGDLFGTAQDVVFELIPQGNGKWKEITLHQFKGAPDGWSLSSGVVLDSSGNIWGTTTSGGTRRCEYAANTSGCGIVYKLTPTSGGKWNETVVYEFARGGGRAVTPSSGFRFESAGHFFGTSLAGGDGIGSVFELTESQKGWEQNVLYRFIGYPDGDFPLGQLEVNSAGALLGVTYDGGKTGYGIIFEVDLSKTNGRRTEKVLHNFAGGADGAYPTAGVISDSHGHLYGTTSGGGSGTACGNYGCGTIYEVTP